MDGPPRHYDSWNKPEKDTYFEFLLCVEPKNKQNYQGP